MLVGLQVSEPDRVREVIRRALVLELLENGEIDQGLLPRQAPAQEGYAAVQHVVIGAAKPIVRLPCRAMKVSDGGHAFVPEPGQGHGREEGMQGAEPDLGPPQGNPRGPEALAASLHQVFHAGVAERPVHQPVGDRIDQAFIGDIRARVFCH